MLYSKMSFGASFPCGTPMQQAHMLIIVKLQYALVCVYEMHGHKSIYCYSVLHAPTQHVADESVLGDNLVPHIATTQTRTKELHDPLVGRYYRQLRKRVVGGAWVGWRVDGVGWPVWRVGGVETCVLSRHVWWRQCLCWWSTQKLYLGLHTCLSHTLSHRKLIVHSVQHLLCSQIVGEQVHRICSPWYEIECVCVCVCVCD